MMMVACSMSGEAGKEVLVVADSGIQDKGFGAERVTSDFVLTDPAALDPVSADPFTSDPIPTDSGIIDPILTDLNVFDPGATDTGSSGTCGSLVAPDISACCKSCGSGWSCQANGCYNGWWCNLDTCKCQKPPDPAACGGHDSGPSADPGASNPDSGSGGPVQGTKLSNLKFAVVGDTRPPNIDDTYGYPTAVITKIWKEIAAVHPQFVISTGDYCFANKDGNQAAPQMDMYLQAESAFSGTVFHVMGNHECTGFTDSNCGPGNKDGMPVNYKTYLAKMVTPMGFSNPWFSQFYVATDGSWTAKVVVIAANAWNEAQASWLDAELSVPTTYTIVARHEPWSVSTAPGVEPSNQIIARHPYTLLVVGHTHTYRHNPSQRELIVGNGGAPLTGDFNYGYVIVERQEDGTLQVAEFDYDTNAVQDRFVVRPDGSLVQ